MQRAATSLKQYRHCKTQLCLCLQADAMMQAALAADLRYDLAQRRRKLGEMDQHEAATIVVLLGSCTLHSGVFCNAR